MGWLRLVGSSKLQVSFAKEPYKRACILQKRPMIFIYVQSSLLGRLYLYTHMYRLTINHAVSQSSLLWRQICTCVYTDTAALYFGGNSVCAKNIFAHMLQCYRRWRIGGTVAVCCSVLQCVAVCCSVLRCVAALPEVEHRWHSCSVLQCVTVCCGVFQCVAVRCSVLQCYLRWRIGDTLSAHVTSYPYLLKHL